MNKDVRKRIDGIMVDIEKAVDARSKLDQMIEALNEAIVEYKETFADIKTAIEEIRDEEQEKFENLTEGLQQSERGQNIEYAVQALENAMEACDGIEEWEEIELSFDSDDIITALDEAKGY